MAKLTYLNFNLKKGCLIRWPEQCFPLPVYIAPFKFYSISQGERSKYESMISEAMRQWEQVSEGRFSFRIVNTLNESQLNVEWRRVDRKSLGNCTFNYDESSRLYSAEVSIGISDGIIHHQYMDENEVFHTILHEFGHALGLGHSDNNGDIMYTPHRYGVVRLSQRDINSVRWLYKLPLGTSIETLNAKYHANFSSIDDAIEKICGGQNKIQQTQSHSVSSGRNLADENARIAELKKRQILMQNIKLPKEMLDKFKGM